MEMRTSCEIDLWDLLSGVGRPKNFRVGIFFLIVRCVDIIGGEFGLVYNEPNQIHTDEKIVQRIWRDEISSDPLSE